MHVVLNLEVSGVEATAQTRSDQRVPIQVIARLVVNHAHHSLFVLIFLERLPLLISLGTLEVEEVKEGEVHKEVTYRYIELLKDGLNQILCGGARCQELIVG